MYTARVINRDDVDYCRVGWSCQLYDKDDHPFYKNKIPITITNIPGRTAFHEPHMLPSWHKMAERFECEITLRDTVNKPMFPGAHYNTWNERQRQYDKWGLEN